MGISSTATRLFSRNSIYVGTIFFGAFAFGIGYDKATSAFWEYHNKGKLWADVKPRYVKD
ncbi:uncharacterized protein L969DRAFT_16088 [Mixia osmundae IAM 14324]|uniref:Complex III subunit 9 n=1 Tax=Mixia osmundae (strain CBS 9802 / IAM 14324 / JCM 22182 / KY 12970) TaxID=764103 RepID=G7E5L5_MIXOS|nr:uncharacterized protein L969DRAFT_16088 [Mixia osmundae IAM 14324]KEI40727.1 hypothetical protein L969DRAFT_16088 [Mixia osmundae IAM 14324]GAA98125.1 hypothetical protein E5Q_04808 [Mixia osmundae IAM 14324]